MKRMAARHKRLLVPGDSNCGFKFDRPFHTFCCTVIHRLDSVIPTLEEGWGQCYCCRLA
jgi:hypothetical protein